ncbi:IgGFc-binding protein-like [Pleurodeles waltl]|uniref:IgGFc-binding protein-like n=1 Tax=Pleurodeles waltl TaxID=8319 RepID=UPI00370947C1
MDGRVRAFQHGMTIRIQTDFHLDIQFDLQNYVKVTVPGSYKGEMRGLCGNYNGDTSGEFTLPDGQLTTDVNAFGAAWAVQAEEPCDPVTCGAPDNPCFTCSEDKKAVFRNKEYCGFLTDVAGPLRDCHSAIKPDAYFENCVYDLCAANGDRMRLCHNIQSYVADCQAAGVTIRPWRSDSFCPMECPENSSYSTCSNICASSCFALVDPWDCPEDCVEGCECDGDLLFDGQQCVPMDKCGCFVDGRYCPLDLAILADDCSKSCTCTPLGHLICEDHSCADDEKCTNEDGVIKCINEDPCKSQKCREKEDCKLVDGKAQCFPQFTGTCWGWGDPHLGTYDGKMYSFQGTCSYILSEYCGNDTTLVPFRVVVKNDVRGGVQSVSYVSEIHTYISGIHITMKKADYPKIRVNDVLYNLPYEEAGLLKVYQSGLQVLLKAGNGLEVTYDWIWHCVLTVPSSYYGATCGLCGNFNQDAEDDMFDPNRNQVTDIIAWAGSWKVYDRDPFCWDYCSGDCPICEESMKSLYSGNQYCGLIINSIDAPFHECHSKVNPDKFFDDCLYDVCMNRGAKQILCQAISAYASTCRKNNVTVYDWRMPSGCPLPCPPNSHYEATGNACPATCLDRTAPDRCTDPPVETCQCDQGFVLSSGECVTINNCGCSSNGVYYKPNEEFWEDKNCERRCRCDPVLGMVVCQTVRCKDSERCMVANGVRGCFPVSYTECSARGDLHYYNYDGRHFDFMGTCAYLLVGCESEDPTLTPFRVIVKNDHRGIKAVSFTNEVTLEMYGTGITLSKVYPGNILVNGTVTCLPFYFKDLQAFRSGDKVVIQTPFGLTIKFDWDFEVSVTIPNTYANAVSGLCGNNNGNADDELTMKDGTPASNEKEFGDSWKVADVPGCEAECNEKCTSCTEEQTQTYLTEEYCGILTKPDGPFSQCYETISQTHYFQDCVFDSCQNQGHQSTTCSAIRAYVTACQAKGVMVKEWRADHFCYPKCPEKSHYELCGSGCPGTCYGLAPPTGCDEPCTEGCFCDSGYLLSGDKCVPIADCGCTYRGRYYQKGEDFFPDASCQERCRCTDSGDTQCVKTSCGTNEDCKVVDGVQGCHPSGFGVCVAVGHGHYISFDYLDFDYQGTCTYTLATICGAHPEHRFSVVVHNVVDAKKIMVSVDHHNITLNLGSRWTVTINQERYNLPVTLDGGLVMVNQEGNNMVVRTGAGEEVLYDGAHYVQVKVPTTYKEKMCGLCGNFNDDPSDDFLLPNGKSSTNVSEFFAAWKLPVKDSECTDGCSSKCPVCSEERTAPYTADTKCGMITATEGPFQNCHTLVDPSNYFNYCLYDMCVLSNDQQALCSSLQAYTAACQDAGAEVHAWRETASCPFTCPANSHYELCTYTCDYTCPALLEQTHCTGRCYEGCESDAGYVFDGSLCVPRNSCGCMYNGRYLQLGMTILVNGCTKSCNCGPGGRVVCVDNSCTNNEKCLNEDGVIKCVNTATCNYTQCEKNYICVMADGKPKCAPHSVVVCQVYGDLHFNTYDGHKYKMQGTCTYTVVKSCEANGQLPPFNVEAKNRNRGNGRVSYVDMINIQAYGQNVTIYAMEQWQVRVNGIKSGLPITLAGGQIHIYNGGGYAVVELKYGLKVYFDWEGYLRVDLKSSYTGRVCGLCGNNNKDPNDDFVTPEGTEAASTEEFVKSWQVEDGDLSCWHDCIGPCKDCPPNLLETYKSESFCGLIAKATDGPFIQCHAKIDPQSYLDNCIYDVCLNNGAKQAACQSLKVYADTCQKAGVAIADWRKAAQCPLECGPNSQYKLCGTACPNTCEDDTASTTCMDPCVESCECKEGFVLNVGKCVPKNTCGCTYKGLPYIQNQVFWEDDKCERLCTCNPNTKQVECRAAQCKVSEKCGIVNGVSGCYPVGYGTCSSIGEPHYNTLDGVRFVYQGDCVYQFSALCNKTVDLVDFQVNVQNEHRGSKPVTLIRTVEFTIYGLATIISRQFPGTVMLNSHRINLPYNTDDGKVRMYKASSKVVIKTDIGITVTFDFQNRITLKLPSTYAGFVCGLCGDFDGDKTNDLTLKNGAKAPNPATFGDSWRTRDIPGCKESTPTPTCPNLQDVKDSQRPSGTDCGVLLSAEGPFQNCHRKVDPEGYFEDCVYDSCFYSGQQATFCPALASYAVACQEAGGQVESWRTETFCPMACPTNSHYELCSTGCPITCSGLTTPAGCDSTCTEGCSCNDGFILSGDQCVDISQCGCLYREKYYKKGEVFYPNGKCNTQCTCQEGGSVGCIPFTCGPNEECTLEDGILKCIPADFGTCAALGDSHYTTLDGHHYDYQGRCMYTLATSSGGNKNLTQFEVKVKHNDYGKMQARVTSMVTLEVYNHSFGMIQSRKDAILVDGVINRLPVSLMDGRVRAFQHGMTIRIQSDFHLDIQFDLQNYVKVTVPGSYKGEMRGLCGNYNGDTSGEFTLPDGQLTTDVNAFGAAWAVQAEEPCDPVTCGAPDNPCFTCSEDKKAVFRNKEYCGFLTDVAGPLRDCHSAIKPDAYFENCVYDLCAANGDRMRLCHNIQSYVADCQAAGVTIRPWRSDSFCPMDCPANSSSSTCSNICASSCFALVDPWDCPRDCVEGCECDGDLLFDGQQCVPMDKCGCFVDGRYYPQGVVVLADDCSKSCTCSPLDGLDCEAHGCADDEKCTNEDGVIKCINKDPCKSKKCRAKEDCKLVDGKAQCFPQFTGTCWGWGDPHLLTYDGKKFSFQGTCSYILSEYCGNDTTLVPFRVVVKNEVRGGIQSISYVSEIHTYIYGNYITMKKAEYLKIGVNGILYNLPYEEAGLLKVYQSGLQVLLKAENGLEVSFDWIWHVVLTLPSSYYGATCGLCGDFNQDAEDDMFDPSRNQVTDIIAWAGSWKVYDRDPFCWDYCSGDCPTCEESMKSLYSGNQYCGLIINSTDGPFRECHSKVNPDKFFDDCLYDVCMNGGAKQILCQALSSYASTCLKSSVTLYDWRMPSACPLPCPPNSHYEASGNACPATCLDRTSPDRCTDPPVETCQCDQGFVLSSGECVAIDNCGCSSNGVYYKPNEEFWEDKNCERQCRCDEALGMVVCQTVRCKDSERCMVANGVRGCFPVSYAECSARGNLHYYTYDGRRFDFMGTCAYLLVGTTSEDPALTPFRIIVKNDHHDIKAVSFTKEVTLELYGSEITLSKDYPGKILVNGTEICLPFYFGDLQAIRSGDNVVIRTDFGVRLMFDWGSEVSVTIPKTYANAVSGLCGNNNGNADDDLTMKDGNSTSNEEEFADSWKVADIPGCEEKCNDKCPSCSEEQKQMYTTEEYCGVLTKPDGPFSQCYETIDPTNYYKDCIFDSCQTHGQQSTVCSAIRAYVTACQAKGVEVKAWRTDHFCHLKCPGKSHYELCGRGCPGTCYGLAPPTGCDEPCTEGCFCDNGFLLSGDTCVPIADCGCTYKGRYYKKGEDFFPDTTCEERCRCTDSGSTECVKTSCGVNEKCKVVNGIQGCHPSGFGICVAAGHRHYLSFDNRAIDYQGTCTYTLAAICSGQHGHRFSVVVGNGRHEKSNVAVAKMVMVSLDHHNITMERGMKWMVKINQERYNLPVTLDGGLVMVNQEGNNIVVRTGAGEEVLYDGEHYVQVKVPNTYKEKMCGLCGNFNGDPSDDFLLPNGESSTNVNEFCAAWKLPVKDSECSDGCGSKCPVCSEERTAPYTADTKCGMITATEGPFQNCHKFVDPTSYFSHCLYDMCALNNDQQALCSNLQAYTAACQDAGAEVHAWRESASCPLTCPASSHYELCTRTCEHTCAALLRPPSCTRRCYEGCECDAWHAFDGIRCVPRKACGCVYNGRYIKVNESIVMPTCTQRCSCGIDGVAVCAPLTCGPNEVCEHRDNVLGCYRAHANCTINMGLDFISFDNQGGKVPSPGAFDLAFVCDGKSKDWFRVVVDLQQCSVESTKAVVFVFFWNAFFAVNDDRQFWLNGRPLPVPIRVNGVITVFRREHQLILEVRGKVQISIGPNADVRVQVWDTYAGKLCGACGNFNDNSDDDLQLSVGGQASDASQMITSWRAPDFSPCVK